LKKSIRFAIIGCGRIAQRHAEHINNTGILAAVCDTVPEKADALAWKYLANAYYSIDDLLANERDIDVVSICTPTELTALPPVRALNAGNNL